MKKSTKPNKSDELITQINEKFENLVNNLDSPQTDQEIKSYLKFAGQFHSYSMRNQMLIAIQADQRNMQLEHIASYKKWSDLKNDNGDKANVQKGEKGFTILVPIKYTQYELDENRKYILDKNNKPIPKLDDNGNPIQGIAFKAGTVFDVNQTNAKEIGAYKTLNYRTITQADDTLLQKLKKEISQKFNITVSEEPTNSQAKGYYSYEDNKIVISPIPTISEKISTLYHELGHHLIHGKQFKEGTLTYDNLHENRGAAEGEAEAFSYILSSMSNIENKSELYIKTWGNDANDLKDRFNLITTTAKEAISQLNLENILTTHQSDTQEEEPKEFTYTKGSLKDQLSQDKQITQTQ